MPAVHAPLMPQKGMAPVSDVAAAGCTERSSKVDRTADGTPSGGGIGSAAAATASSAASPPSPAGGDAGAAANAGGSGTRDDDAGFQGGPGLLCGLASGTATTAVFNPYDRALFLSVRDHRPFLSQANFRTPYQGLMQSIAIRAISGGLWFPLEHFFRDRFAGNWGFLAGSAAGILSSAVLNPLTAIKYQTWGREESGAVVEEAMRMWRRGGVEPFTFGLRSRVLRDVVFGAVYTGLRQQGNRRRPTGVEPQLWEFGINSASATAATVVSGPLNYVQNLQYATSSKQHQPTVMEAWRKLVRDTRTEPGGLVGKLSFVQQRLRIGWGTARVAVGMAFGNWIYDGCVSDWHHLRRWMKARREEQRKQEAAHAVPPPPPPSLNTK